MLNPNNHTLGGSERSRTWGNRLQWKALKCWYISFKLSEPYKQYKHWFLQNPCNL